MFEVPNLVNLSLPAWLKFNPVFSAGDVISAISILGAISMFYFQNRKTNRLQRTEIYQRLEFASNELFSFEAEHAESMEKYRDRSPIESKFGQQWGAFQAYANIEAGLLNPKAKLRGHYEKLEREVRIVRKYYEKSLNLFEVSTRFRHEGIIDERVYGSWVIWYFETCGEWAFRWMWPDLRKNYMREVRDIFDYPVTYFEFGKEPIETLERDFFIHVGRLTRCRVISDWLDSLESTQQALETGVEQSGIPSYPRWPIRLGFGKAPKPVSRKNKADSPLPVPPPYAEISLPVEMPPAVPEK